MDPAGLPRVWVDLANWHRLMGSSHAGWSRAEVRTGAWGRRGPACCCLGSACPPGSPQRSVQTGLWGCPIRGSKTHSSCQGDDSPTPKGGKGVPFHPSPQDPRVTPGRGAGTCTGDTSHRENHRPFTCWYRRAHERTELSFKLTRRPVKREKGPTPLPRLPRRRSAHVRTQRGW